MAGYVRQASADIVPTAIVRAAPINNEYNAIRDAFAQASGHRHDGTAAEGAYVSLISDTNAYNKVVVDSTNNRLGFFVNVSSAAAEQVRLAQNVLNPLTNNVFSLGTSPLKFKDLFLAGIATIASVVAASATISGGTINATTIGASTPSTGVFTNLTVNTAATIASAAISAGTINGTVIGGTTAAAITGTTITATTGFVGSLSGAVTGNVTGNLTGNVTGNITGNVTGNVTASSGTSTFNNVTINGTLDMDSSSANTITGLTSPTNSTDAATKGYVDTSISSLIASAPGTLDTLNELAAALGNDASFSTTVTNSIATKLALAGGTMTGAIAMGTNKITGLGTPTANTDAATKGYVDTADSLKLDLSGGTMSGAIAMGTNKITGMGDPTNAQDATTKTYVDGILGSATAAATSAAAAAASASSAATSASNASTSATNAASSASAAAASYDSFDDRYLGPKASDPSLDNDSNALLTGALYFNTTSNEMRVYTGSAWVAAYLPASFNALSPITTTGDLIIGTGVNTASRLGIGANGYLLTSDGSTASWAAAPAAGVTSFAGGTTGLTPASATTGAVTLAGTLAVANGGTGRTVGNYSVFANELHVSKNGNDSTGDGTLINPVLTITKALTLIGAGVNTVIVHPGTYTENPTVTDTNTTIATSELTGANTLISGTLTLSAAARVSGLKMTNLTITGAGNTYISNCTVDTQVVKSGSNYVEIINSELQCAAGVQITGAGAVSIVGNKCWAVAVSNASANVLIKDSYQVITPSVTAGTLQLDGSAIFAASPASNAVTSSAGSFITLANCFVLNSAGTNVERVSLAGFYSILNLVYDKTNSTFAGTNLNAIDYFSVINADTLVLTNDLAIAYGGTNSSATPTAGGAVYGTGTAYAFTAAGTAGQVLVSNGSSAPTWSTVSSTVANGCIYLNNLTISANYTIASAQGAHSVGPITVASGATLTVSSGSRYVVS